MTCTFKPQQVALVAIAAVVLVAILATSCASATGGSHDSKSSVPSLRLGYFPNITHSAALVGLGSGALADSVEPLAQIEPTVFSAGPAVVEAIFAGKLDIAFIGPNPAINAYAKSKGHALRVIAGATSGGAALVVRPGIKTPRDLQGATLATPQLGSTQDISARAWLRSHGLSTDVNNGGDVSIIPQPNSRTLDAFFANQIDGAWVPEPWATRLVQEAGAKVLVNENDIWPNHQWASTLVVARTEFLNEHPQIVKALLAGLVGVVDSLNQDPHGSQIIANDQIEAITGKRISDQVLGAAWQNLDFTLDPIPSSVTGAATNAVEVGLLEPIDIENIFDLRLLDEVLAEADLEQVGAP